MGAAHTPVPSWHVKCTDRLARFFPKQYLLLLPQMIQLSSVQVHPIFTTLTEENETYLGAKISPESIAFIHKAHRSLLLLESLFFCSALIRERWCKMLTMSTATTARHCLNTSSSFSRDFRTGACDWIFCAIPKALDNPVPRLHKQQH